MTSHWKGQLGMMVTIERRYTRDEWLVAASGIWSVERLQGLCLEALWHNDYSMHLSRVWLSKLAEEHQEISTMTRK